MVNNNKKNNKNWSNSLVFGRWPQPITQSTHVSNYFRLLFPSSYKVFDVLDKRQQRCSLFHRVVELQWRISQKCGNEGYASLSEGKLMERKVEKMFSWKGPAACSFRTLVWHQKNIDCYWSTRVLLSKRETILNIDGIKLHLYWNLSFELIYVRRDSM